uniref:Uncharacterized protein n=1 Tax=Aureoumbra lagunensis TaxID=44058 RepID=A0A7S3JYT1_9STRA
MRRSLYQDEPAPFVMDLSKKRLSRASVDTALRRLSGVLEEEELFSSQRRGYLARGLELNLSQNLLDSFALPMPTEEEEVSSEIEDDETTTSTDDNASMMDMMLMGNEKKTSRKKENEIFEKKKPNIPIEDRLVALNLSHNRLGPKLNNSLRGIFQLWRLARLDLSHNRIDSSGGLVRLENLRELILAHNNLREVEALSALVQLEILDLSFNLLTITALRPLAMNKELCELRLDSNKAIQAAPPEAKRALRLMLPKLRRVSGIEKGLEFIPPADRRHDAYFDLHLRRRKSSLEKETSRALTTTNSRMKQDHIFSSAHSQKQNNEEQDDTPRDIGLARRLQAEIAAIEPASVSIQPEPLTETQITEARAQLPWRQPPNPIPRWMVEQHIGKDAAKVALRRSDAAIKKKNHNSTTDHRPPSSFGTRDRRRLENYHNTSAPLSSTKTKRNTKKKFCDHYQ